MLSLTSAMRGIASAELQTQAGLRKNCHMLSVLMRAQAAAYISIQALESITAFNSTHYTLLSEIRGASSSLSPFLRAVFLSGGLAFFRFLPFPAHISTSCRLLSQTLFVQKFCCCCLATYFTCPHFMP